jgi:hypothetical protein
MTVCPSFEHELTALPFTVSPALRGHAHAGLQQSQYRVVFAFMVSIGGVFVDGCVTTKEK